MKNFICNKINNKALIAVLLLLSMSFTFLTSCKPKPKVTESQFPVGDEVIQSSDSDTPPNQFTDGLNAKRKDGFYNFLVLGHDRVGLNTDVIMVVSYDTKNKKVAIVQIPRDTYVEYAGAGRKINSVFAVGYNRANKELISLKSKAKGADSNKLSQLSSSAGIKIDAATLKSFAEDKITRESLCEKYGMESMKEVLLADFGLVIDYDFYVGLDGFEDVVNTVAPKGLAIHIQEDMKYSDPEQDLYIDLKKGDQILNGEQCMQFIRFRYGYANADIARIEAQKIFMTAFLKELFKTSTITKIPGLIGTINKYVSMSLSLNDAIWFATQALGLKLSDITMFTMQGRSYSNGVSYYAMNKKANLQIVNKYFNVFDTDIPESAIKVPELVKFSDDSVVTGLTAEDISTKQPDLGFIKSKPKTTTKSSPGTTQTQPETHLQPEDEPATSEPLPADDPAVTEGEHSDGTETGAAEETTAK